MVSSGFSPHVEVNRCAHIGTCTQNVWWVIVASAAYSVRHFAMTTDINQMISPDLPWREREISFLKTFPEPGILVVVDAPTPEFVELASSRSVEAVARRMMSSVRSMSRGWGFF